MLGWFRKKFTNNDAPESDVEATPESRPLRTNIRFSKRKPLNVAAIQTANVQRTAEAHAMDSTDIDMSTLKGALSFNRNNVSDTQYAFFGSQGFIGYQTMAMIAQNWLVGRAILLPARDSTANGYEISTANTDENQDVLERIRDLDEMYGINKHLEEFVYFNGMFGIRIAMFDIDSDDPQYYEKPFNPDGIKPGSYKGISQIDPYWITPQLEARSANDPAYRHFYEPTYWMVNGRRIHRSHLVIIRGQKVADILKPTYMYGGVSMVQRIFERVYAAERTANEGPTLAQSKRMTVLHLDIEKMMADPINFENMMTEWVGIQNNHGVKIVGEDEKIEQFDTTLTDLDVTISTQYQLVAAVSGIPVTKLLGTTPKGFNATGEAEEANYHEDLKSTQRHDLSPLLSRHHLCLMRSEFGERAKSIRISHTWRPLDAVTAKEQAEINKLKAETGAVLITSGAIDSDEERNRVRVDPTSDYDNLADAEPELIDDDTTQ
jgi:phage-related protein (TIGR01555 family)